MVFWNLINWYFLSVSFIHNSITYSRRVQGRSKLLLGVEWWYQQGALWGRRQSILGSWWVMDIIHRFDFLLFCLNLLITAKRSIERGKLKKMWYKNIQIQIYTSKNFKYQKKTIKYKLAKKIVCLRQIHKFYKKWFSL